MALTVTSATRDPGQLARHAAPLHLRTSSRRRDHRQHDGRIEGLKDLSRRPDEHFDAAYYRRFYQQPDTAVVTPAMQRNEVAFVLAFCRHIGLEVKRFTDVGAGTGWWAREFAKRCPTCAHIETFDASEAACRVYGHRRVELQKLGGRESDLVVCRDVLRYLSDRDAEKGIRRLARKCRGVLYVHAITRDDEIDEDASDMAGFFRSTAWYRKRLRAAGFVNCGMGLFVSKKLDEFNPFSLEVLP